VVQLAVMRVTALLYKYPRVKESLPLRPNTTAWGGAYMRYGGKVPDPGAK